MRFMAVFAFLFLLAVNANANEGIGNEQAGQVKAQGVIYATVKIADDLKAEFLYGPDSELPKDIVAKVSPALMAKAREAHTSAPAADGVYRVAIDWKVVSVDGQDQMKFEYRNAEPYPIVREEPAYPRLNPTGPIEIVYHIVLASDGSVTDISRSDETAGNIDFYHAGRAALKHWKFSPRYKDGVATAREILLPLIFKLPTDSPHGLAPGEVEVSFTLSVEGVVDEMNIFGELPECIDEAEFRQQAIEDIAASEAVRQIRAGESEARDGVLLYQLEGCEGAVESPEAAAHSG